jgi:hypothetical protein
MRNFINQQLVEERELGDVDVHELNCLHYIMNAVIRDHHEFLPFMSEADVLHSCEAVECLEYAMQRQWGFPEMKSYHTHKDRLLSKGDTTCQQ